MSRRPHLALVATAIAFMIIVTAFAGAGRAAAAVATPTGLGLADAGQYTTGIKVQWAWSSAVTKYEIQSSDAASFSGAKTTAVARATKALADNTQAVTVKSLDTASFYYFRVRALSGTTASAWSDGVKLSTAVAWPDPITAVTAAPGDDPGTVTISWTSTGQNTSYYRIEAAQTIFSRTDKALPEVGRDGQAFKVDAPATSVTLTEAQLTKAGAPLGSANHIYFRIFAVTEGEAGSHERSFANLRWVGVKAEPATAQLAIRVGSYNMRTAGAGDTTPFTWPERAPYAAKTIMSRTPGILALQELSPGPSDGKSSPVRQTDSLITELTKAGGKYALVRRASYYAPGTPMGNTGMRIAYDTSRYELLSDCPETTKIDGATRGYNPSCSFLIPLRPQDPENFHRSASYAQFKDKASGAQFWMVSVHLEHRQSDDQAEEDSLEALRADQIQFTIDQIEKMDTDDEPIIIAGDLNTWQNQGGEDGYDAHSVLIKNGFWDTAAAVSQVNMAYSTVNNFAATMTPSTSGFGARLDTIAVKGATGATRFENVLNPTDPRRGSDHNMIVSDFKIPVKKS